MDCRRSLLVALCLAGFCSGCVTRSITPPGGMEMLAAVDSDKIKPYKSKRAPSVDLAVAYAAYSARGAEQPSATPAQQQTMREQARKAYQEALQIDPNCKEAHLGLGRLYVQAKEHDKALEVFQKALKKHPKEAALWYEQGICLCRKKDFKAAAESLHKAHTLQPENREYGTQLGLCLARAGRTDEGVACLSRVLGPAEAHFNVARMLDHLNQPDMARRHLQLALQRKPDHAGAAQMLGQLEGTPPAEQAIITIQYEAPVQQ
jgi:tetratricopeptide (TPR) repeat protein